MICFQGRILLRKISSTACSSSDTCSEIQAFEKTYFVENYCWHFILDYFCRRSNLGESNLYSPIRKFVEHKISVKLKRRRDKKKNLLEYLLSDCI